MPPFMAVFAKMGSTDDHEQVKVIFVPKKKKIVWSLRQTG